MKIILSANGEKDALRDSINSQVKILRGQHKLSEPFLAALNDEVQRQIKHTGAESFGVSVLFDLTIDIPKKPAQPPATEDAAAANN